MAGRLASPEVRAQHAVLNVLPSSVAVDVRTGSDEAADLVVAGQALEVKWAGEGNLGDVRKLGRVGFKSLGYCAVISAMRMPEAKVPITRGLTGTCREARSSKLMRNCVGTTCTTSTSRGTRTCEALRS